MALVSGGRSTLNPNAPLFVPAAMRQVEDYSPEWYDLITTSTWFRDYWLSQQRQGEDISQHGENNDIVQILPDNIDCGVDDDILNMEAQYEEFLQSSQGYNYYGTETASVITQNGYGKNAGEMMKNPGMSEQGILKSPWEATYNWTKPSNAVSRNFIQQPR